MNTKKTINVFRGLALAGCFITVQHTVAQSWPGSQTGPNEGRWILNKNKSNAWAHMRLQVSNNKAWNMINQGDLWWGYAANDTFTDTGTERMRLTTDGQLYVSGIARFNGTASTMSQGAHIGWNALTGSTGETDFINHKGLGTGGFAFYNTEGDGSVKTLQMRIDGSGNVGIGTSTPQTKLDVNGTGHFSGNVGIGTSTPQTKLDVNGLLTVRHEGDNSTIEFLADNNKSASIGVQDDNDEGFYILTNGAYRLNVNQNGNVGIGTTTASTTFDVNGTGHFSGNVGIGTTSPSEKLEVTGNIKADGVVLNIGSFPDYVFEKGYPLMPLSEVEKYITANKHLPGFPSEAEVVKNGANLGQLNNLLVEKVEELTLHTIAQEKLLNTQEKQINKLLEALNTLKAEVKALKKQ